MPTIIDSLVVELGLDPKKFQQGQKDAVEALKKLEEQAARGGKNVEKSVGGVEEKFALLQKRLIGVAALMFGGLSIDKFIEKMTKLNVATANQAGWLDVSAQNMRTWANAAERAGVSGDAAAQGLGAITRQRTEWLNNRNQGGLMVLQRGANASAAAGRGTGIQLFGGQDHSTLLDSPEVAARLHTWLQSEIKAGRGTTARAALRDNGGLPEEFVTLLANPKMKEFLESAKNLAPKQDEIDRYKKLNEAMSQASQTASRLGQLFVDMISPQLITFLEGLNKALGITVKLVQGDAGAKIEAQIIGDLAQKKKIDDFVEKLEKKGIAVPEGTKQEQQRLAEEIKRLREELEKGRQQGGVQNQSFTGGGAGDGGGSMLHNIMYGGGGAAGGGGVGNGPRWPGGGGGIGGDPDFGQQAGPLHGPAADYLAQKRAPFAEQLKDPSTRRLLGAIISAENPGAGPAVAESLMNRTELVNADRARKGLPPLSLKDMILGHRSIAGGNSFYGPVRSGAVRGHLSKMDHNADFAARMNRFIDQALGGSDLTRGHTDQGSAGDPNYSSGGVGVNINRERFNDWGYPSSRAWRQQRQREMDDYAKRPSNPNARTPTPTPDPRRAREWTNLIGSSHLAAYSPEGSGGISTASHMTIGDVHVHTAATDAQGIAKALKPALQRFAGVMSSNNGPT